MSEIAKMTLSEKGMSFANAVKYQLDKNVFAINNNTNVINNKEIKENKEKINTTNNTKNKVAPIKRKNVPKKINEKEKEIKDEEDNEENNEIVINIKSKPKEEKIKEKNIIIKESKEKKEYDLEIKDYKTYLHKIEKNKEKINYDPNIINSLLSQMNSLSEKQLSLIDVMDNIQMETQGHIKELNKRITKLERNIEDLNNELYYIKNDN